MKRTISFVIASAAVAMALVSCTKENISNNEGEKGINADGTRTLTVSFATKATKTSLLEDGITPVWKEGDQISLNGITYNVPSEAYDKTEFTITTDIQGTITAVYPADAYQSTEPYFKVSDEQDGSFGCANICVAQAAAGENTLTFENVTAVFAVAVPEGTRKLTVTSLGKIDSETGQRGKDADDKVAIGTTEEGDASNVIIVEKENKSEFGDTVYVAVAVDPENGVLLADLNFDTGKAQGGVSPNYIKSKGQDPLEYKAAAGTIYTPVLHEYVVVDGKKWATMNVGATEANPNGLYFAWGETTGHVAATNGDSAFTNAYSGNEAGFSWTNCPLSNHDENDWRFSKYVPEYCKEDYAIDGNYYDDKTVLDLEDDAAFWNWGGAWRMPKSEEFVAIKDTKANWNNGYTFGSGSNTFFLPAAGGSQGADLQNQSTCGLYWTSSLCTEPNGTDQATCLFFDNGAINTTVYYRFHGYPIRPLSE